jgi:hypothetical protein
MSQRETDELYQSQVAAATTENVHCIISQDANYNAFKPAIKNKMECLSLLKQIYSNGISSPASNSTAK